MAYIQKAAGKAKEYDKLKNAIDDAETKGYGVVVPTLDSYKLDTPRLYKKPRRITPSGNVRST